MSPFRYEGEDQNMELRESHLRYLLVIYELGQVTLHDARFLLIRE